MQDNSDAPAETRGNLPKNIHKLKKRKTQLHSIRLLRKWIEAAASTIRPKEREFVVDSGASMYMVSKKDLNKAELETAKKSKNPTTVVIANGDVRTKEEATVYVKELDKLVTLKLLEDTPAVLSLRKLCEDH